MSFTFTLLSVALVVGVLYARACLKKSRLSAPAWEELVRKLEEVPMIGISKVALSYLEPGERQLSIQTNEMWILIGGNEGLKRMQENAEILLQLAAFAQQWNLQESIIVGEQMRREALVLRRAVSRIQRGLLFDCGTVAGPFYVQEAASAYYLMRQHLLALYGTSTVGRHGRLSIALGNGLVVCGPAV